VSDVHGRSDEQGWRQQRRQEPRQAVQFTEHLKGVIVMITDRMAAVAAVRLGQGAIPVPAQSSCSIRAGIAANIE
jgi:hypothetical protein